MTDVGDDGLFGPDSVAWRVHGELATLIGGLRALMLQTLHPLAMAGVADHSAFRSDPFGRLQRTAGFLAATVFGTTDDADRAIATRAPGPPPRAGHRARRPAVLGQRPAPGHVRARDRGRQLPRRPPGLRPLPAEPGPTPTATSARWPWSPAASAAATCPRTWPSCGRGSKTSGPSCALTGQARDAVRFLLVPPLPLSARPAYAIVSSASIGLLPLWAQRMLWLPSFPPVDRLAVRPAMRSILGVLDWAVRGSPHKASARLRVAETG